uniref:Uncharacterized protein n=1 Tax=Cacopsylla melanoneura TaxID=428564 RepID=A0A8D9DX57_9HEMI
MKTQRGSVVGVGPGWCTGGTGSPGQGQERAVITGDTTERTLSMKLPTIPAHPVLPVLPILLIVKVLRLFKLKHQSHQLTHHPLIHPHPRTCQHPPARPQAPPP